MENENNNWYFTKEELDDSPSRKSGIDASKELSYRQQAANFIQDMGQRLQVSQLCINTAIVYMHRFYVFHSFTKIHRNNVAICALFLAAKVEEQPRKLEHVIKISHMCLHRDEPTLDSRSEVYLEKQAELVQYENVMLQTLGFNIGIEHPHTYVVKLCQLVKASKDLAQTSYFMATNSLHLTTMCLQHKPTIVASVCIHLACKWSNWKIEKCKEGKEWFYYVDKSVTLELLEELTKEFIQIMENCPNRLRRKVASNGKDSQYSDKYRPEQSSGRAEKDKAFEIKHLAPPKKGSSPLPSSSFVKEDNEIPSSLAVAVMEPASVSTSSSSPAKKIKIEAPSSAPMTLAAYREKKEKERQEQKILQPEMPSASTQNHSVEERHPKHMVNHEKGRHPVTHPKQPELTIAKTIEKSNKENVSIISDADSTGFGKFNHQSPRLPVGLHHHKDNKHTKVSGKSASEDIKNNCEMSSLLNNEVFDHLDSAENFIDAISQGSRMHHDGELKIRTKSPAAIEYRVPESERTARKMLESAVPNKVPKVKQHKNAAIIISHNSHEKPLPIIPQVNTLKHSPNVDGAKANGSKIIEQVIAVQHPLPNFDTTTSRPSESSSNRNERKEKHSKHKHSMSNKEKVSNHHIEPPSDQNHPVGLKITIPKDKINLSGIRQESSHKSNSVKPEDQGKKGIKIKIQKPKLPGDDTKVGMKSSPSGSGIKLVFTKNKSEGSYSTAPIQDKSSRKRDRSPRSSESNSRNSYPTGKPPKSVRLEQRKSNYHQDSGIAPVPTEQKFSRHSVPVETEQQNPTGNKQVNSGWMYHQMNDGPHLSQYVIPYGAQACHPPPPPPYYHQPALHMNAGLYQNQMVPHLPYGHLPPPPPPPPSGPPPLPRDPPPPLPPQPPPPV